MAPSQVGWGPRGGEEAEGHWCGGEGGTEGPGPRGPVGCEREERTRHPGAGGSDSQGGAFIPQAPEHLPRAERRAPCGGHGEGGEGQTRCAPSRSL